MSRFTPSPRLTQQPRFTPPPGWPEPPPGWVPPLGWQPDPAWPPAPPGWNFWSRPSRWKLDPAVAQANSERWTIWLGVAPILAIVAVLGLEYLSLGGWHPHGAVRDIAFAIGSILHYAVAVAVIVRIAGPLVDELGGWLAALGLSWPNLRDAVLAVAGAAAEYIGRIVASVILLIAIPALRHGSANNIGLSGRPVAEVVTLIVVAVLIAPPIEELIFRGLLLRALMRRMRFWPAALISTGAFAVLHLYEVSGGASRVLLFASIFVFGLGQCLLVRWTGRLGPSIAAHAISNAVAAVITLAAGLLR